MRARVYARINNKESIISLHFESEYGVLPYGMDTLFTFVHI